MLEPQFSLGMQQFWEPVNDFFDCEVNGEVMARYAEEKGLLENEGWAWARKVYDLRSQRCV